MEKLRESGKYNVHEKVVNTAQNGIPQNRPRLYIVGILKEIDTGRFEWPKDIPSCNVSSLLDTRDQETACIGLPDKEAATASYNVREFTKALMAKGVAPHVEEYFIACDADWTRSKCWLGQSPCLLSRNRKGCG
jgi:site-specific DNA-cytosine methylase